MMPQSQNAEYSNGTNNNGGIAVAPQNSHYPSNQSISGQISMITPNIQNQNLMAAALHLNQSTQGYINPGLATIGYIYPNNNSFVQATNLMFNPHNILHPQVEMISSGSSSLGHISSSGIHHNHKLSGYDNIQHFGSLSQNPSRKPKNSVMSKTNLYINGLQETDTDESVRALVEGIIDPKSCKAMLSHGKCRGSGFIDCANESDAELVIHTLRNRQMPGGSRLAVKFAYENEKDDLNVYVRNLPRNSSFNNNNLEEMFRDYGQVVSVKLLQSDNQYTGTGFVRFSSADEAQRAVDTMNAKKLLLTDEDKPVICKLADKGGRRINSHSMVSCVDNQQSMEGNEQMVNGSVPQISPENGGDKNGYGLSLMAAQQYSSSGHPWLSHATNPDLLVQELQSLGLAQANAASYLMPGLMHNHLPMPYNDEAALQQQQQLLAQILWSQARMQAQAYHHPSQVVPQQQHQPQQQPQQPVQVPSATQLMHWPPVHQHHQQQPQQAPQHTNNHNVFYSTEHSYPTMLYQPQQYRQSRPLAPMPNLAHNPISITSNKSLSSDQSVLNNCQSPSSNQPLMNGVGVSTEPQSKM